MTQKKQLNLVGDLKRFESKVKKTPDGCWLWTGADSGYGVFRFRGAIWRAHRVAVVLYKGIELRPPGDSIEDRSVDPRVCHTCDTPLCVNPDHLSVGTAKTNMQDMARKGRGSNGVRYRGLDNPRGKLPDVQVKAIKDLFETGSYKQVELAEMFDVTRSHIWKIVRQGFRS